LTVGVVCGGTSPERSISLRSGRAVLGALKRSGIHAIRIDPARRSKFIEQIRRADLLFLALHGKGGEDGCLQAWLERRGIPFTASGSEACRRSFDKLITKRHLERLKIPTPAYTVIKPADWRLQCSRFPVPYFVKPLDGGSSQGIFLVEDFKKSAEKIRRSLLRHKRLLIEKKIIGRELTAGILGDCRLPVIEVRPKRSFYDYKAKYTKGMTEYIVPAKIPRKVSGKIRKLAWKAFRGLGLSGFARVDFMLDRNERPFALEVNSIPGLTEFSLLPKAARVIGISFEELCLRLLRAAVEPKKMELVHYGKKEK